MSIFDGIFSSKGRSSNYKNLIQSQFLDEINTIILVLENLDYLDKETIKKKLESSNEKISLSTFNKLNINSLKEQLPNLSKYYPMISLGYGKEATKKLHSSLENQSVVKYDSKNKEEVKEELIQIANEYIENYSELLISIEKELQEYKEKLKTENEIKELAGRLIVKMKEQQLGYPMDLEREIIKMSNSLRNQKYGGYSDSLIEEFKELCKKEIESRKSRNITSYEILRYIEDNIYSKKIAHYKQDVEQTEKQLIALSNANLPDSEKEVKKEMIILTLRKNYGHEININKTINELADRLFAISTKETEEEFINKATSLVNELRSQNKEEIFIVASLNVLYVLYKSYANKDIKKQEQHQETIEQYMENLLNSLKNTEEGYSYGEEAINQFREEFKNLIRTEKSNPKELLKSKCQQLKDLYQNNKEVFIQWIEDRLKSYKGNDREGYKEELNSKVDYMLSLSPRDLNKYFEKDNEEKKKKVFDHNQMVALKYLARKEYHKTKNKEKYNETLLRIRAGDIPFTEEKIKEALSTIEMITIFDEENLGTDEKILGALDFIDSTLFNQMVEATQNVSIKNKH